jgi:hypothetical protein
VVTAGTTITGLTYRVLSESGEELEFDPAWFKMKNTGLNVSWVAEKGNKKMKTASNKLPDIKVGAWLLLNMYSYIKSFDTRLIL